MAIAAQMPLAWLRLCLAPRVISISALRILFSALSENRYLSDDPNRAADLTGDSPSICPCGTEKARARFQEDGNARRGGNCWPNLITGIIFESFLSGRFSGALFFQRGFAGASAVVSTMTDGVSDFAAGFLSVLECRTNPLED